MTKNLASQRAKPNWEFSATSTTPTTSPIFAANAKRPTAPRVIYTTKVWQSIQYVIAECPKELGWLGTVDVIDGDYWITDIFIPKQEISGVTTEIEAEDFAAVAEAVLDSGKCSSSLIYWGHSHVNMAVGPSAQDEAQLAEYLDNCPVFIRGIYNKRGETKVDIFNRDAGVVHQCVRNFPEHDLIPTELADELDALMKANLTERRYLPPQAKNQSWAGYGSYQGYEDFKKSQTQKQQPQQTWLTGAYSDDDIYDYMYGKFGG